MIKILDLNDNSKDIEIGTANVDRVYGGRGGKKVAGKIGDDYYLIKMPNNLVTRERRPDENIEIPYNNSPLSEYIGSHVYEIIGMNVHKTYLGYRNNGNWGILKNEMTHDKKIAPAIRKQYYKTLIRLRYEKCLLPIYNSMA